MGKRSIKNGAKMKIYITKVEIYNDLMEGIAKIEVFNEDNFSIEMNSIVSKEEADMIVDAYKTLTETNGEIKIKKGKLICDSTERS